MTRSRLVLGPTCIAVGALALAGVIGDLDASAIVARWWPLVVVTLGLAQLLGQPRNRSGGACSLVVGGALLAATLGYLEPWTLIWPVLLIALGLWLVLGRPRGAPWPTRPEEVAIVDDREVRVPAGPYGGGAATTVFGDLTLDLGATTLAPGGAVLQATTVFGDLELRIPAGWSVRVDGPELFGHVDVEAGTPPPPSADTLTVRVTAIFGDVRIRRATSSVASRAPEHAER